MVPVGGAAGSRSSWVVQIDAEAGGRRASSYGPSSLGCSGGSPESKRLRMDGGGYASGGGESILLRKGDENAVRQGQSDRWPFHRDAEISGHHAWFPACARLA
jgi:hypothetical protein